MKKSKFINSVRFQLLLSDEENFRSLMRNFADRIINDRQQKNKSLYAIVKFYNDSYNKKIDYIVKNIINNRYPGYIINDFIDYLNFRDGVKI
jgi:hypothetical protein